MKSLDSSAGLQAAVLADRRQDRASGEAKGAVGCSDVADDGRRLEVNREISVETMARLGESHEWPPGRAI